MAAVNPFMQADHLTLAVGDKTLFRDITFGIAEGQHIGLIAQNGTGKTSLLNIIAGREAPDEGTVTFRRDLKVAYLEQTPTFPAGMTVLEALTWHNQRYVGSRIGDFVGSHDGDTLARRMEEYLSRLGITDTGQRVETLSGGQLKRVALAGVLLQDADLLILDEPTNHLDLVMTEWLEGYLGRAAVALLMVTHDRYFLDRVCTQILELDDQTLYSYKGSYAYYLEKRQERVDARNAEVARANNLYRTELEWMRRMPQARGHKARYREEAFADLERRAHQPTEQQQLSLTLNSTYIGSKIFEAEYVSKAFGPDKMILKDFYYNFSRYEKMGIIGANGTGKSTFVRMLMGLEKPDSGRFVIGETVRFGYFSQEGMHFDEQMRVIDAVRRVAEYVDLGGGRHLSAMQFLQHFMFTPLQQQNYVYKLSGGERRRLYLCTVLMQNPNFLILDEPTNDLDIVTLNILEEYLRTFRGCVIVVSHDRYFMDKVVDHLLVFNGDGDVDDFPGNYTQYRQAQAEKASHQAGGKAGRQAPQSGRQPTAKGADTPAPRSAADARPRRLSFKERRELEQLEADIAALEAEKGALEAALCSGTLAVAELTAKSRRLPQLQEELDAKEMRWLELSEIGG